MPDYKHRDSLLPTMNRRAFLATMGVAAGSIVMGTPLPGLRAGLISPLEQRSSSAPLSPHPNMGEPYATGC